MPSATSWTLVPDCEFVIIPASSRGLTQARECFGPKERLSLTSAHTPAWHVQQVIEQVRLTRIYRSVHSELRKAAAVGTPCESRGWKARDDPQGRGEPG